MRVAYVAEWDAHATSGVLKKIVSQVAAWARLGVESRLFLVTPSSSAPPVHGDPALIEVLGTLPRACRRLLPAPLVTYANKLLTVPALARSLEAYAPHLVYYRQGLWYPGLRSVLAGAPYVVELNSHDDGELRIHGGWMRWKLHERTRDGVLGGAAGFACVSREIAENVAAFAKPTVVIANGYDLSAVSPVPPTRNAQPTLVFAGSPRSPWNGVDKIPALASRLPEMTFHIAGDDARRLEAPLPPNIVCHGFLTPDRLRALYQISDVGLSTLSLHRQHMEEASPLKTREYLAHGLPVVVAYRDSDVAGEDFLLDIGNHEANVVERAADIGAFARAWRGRRVERERVRKLDVTVKEEARLEFFRRLLAELRLPRGGE